MTSAPSPPTAKYALLSFPLPHILLVTLNRPRDLNCINSQGHAELAAIWEWMDANPAIRVGVLTGSGKAFCAGADLKEWLTTTTTTTQPQPQAQNTITSNSNPTTPSTGFGGLSRRTGKKPIVLAVNGLCLGGGSEMAVNADVVIASERAYFGFPEVARGVVAWAGALPRLVRTVGRQRALEMVLTGRKVSAWEAQRWGFVNEVVSVDAEGEPERDVVHRALEVAGRIAANSPDAVVVSRAGVNLGWDGAGADEATVRLMEEWMEKLNAGENIKEGLRAFVEKRSPKWVDNY
ncbi:enoyl-CoA hydratase/isomerase family protein [Aspergillus homomorphus CBS 101889]|uniref:Enoyl-CoA hydratase n=1 Tax=Aspergillus homomorphus (strain CBS 101889) TaxID=1450537 RepID=A0A395HUY5_ASPHC|nr:enoyl-CoA hydratase [Aspergillus homomorphus CBS 101889]RAL11610.1 enoyl-CoA hydratase [Aspergillus homomorphus CBS 101889]